MGSSLELLLIMIGMHQDCEQCRTLRDQMDQSGRRWCLRERRRVIDRLKLNAAAFGVSGWRLTYGSWMIFWLAFVLSFILPEREAHITPEPQPEPSQEPAANYRACKLRGDFVRLAQFTCCGGEINDVEVFACRKYGECTLERNVGPSVCASCTGWMTEDYTTHADASPPLTHSPVKGGTIVDWEQRRRERDGQVLSMPTMREHGDEEGLVALANCRRNLAYYIYPLARSEAVWKRNILLLKRRLEVFNGKRVVCIATDQDSASADEVKREFGDGIDHYLEVANHPILGEVVGFVPMLELLSSLNQNDLTFYAHAKGVRHGDSDAVTVHAWTTMMYELCLDYVPLVERQLSRYSITGPFKKIGKQFGGSEAQWHYTGTFYWFKNAEIFADPKWRMVDQIYGGVESWPGLRVNVHKAGCLYLSGTASAVSMYSMQFMHDEILPRLEEWRRRHAHLQTIRTAPPKMEEMLHE